MSGYDQDDDTDLVAQAVELAMSWAGSQHWAASAAGVRASAQRRPARRRLQAGAAGLAGLAALFGSLLGAGVLAGSPSAVASRPSHQAAGSQLPSTWHRQDVAFEPVHQRVRIAPDELFGVGRYDTAASPFASIYALASLRDGSATYVETTAADAVALLRRLSPAAGWWSEKRGSGCPDSKLEAESGSGPGALALIRCTRSPVVVVEWSGAGSLATLAVPSLGPATQTTGNVAFFVDQPDTGDPIGGLLTYRAQRNVNLAPLGAPARHRLPQAIPVHDYRSARQVDLSRLSVTSGATSPRAGSTPGGSSKSVALCSAVAGLDRLVVRRSDAFPQNHLRFSFPAVLTVAVPAEVRLAARSICALPMRSPGVYHCPADFGVLYHLSFSGPGRSVGAVTANPAGCELVSGAGSVRSTTPSFWKALGRALGLRQCQRPS